jgi:hypothetical protein
LPIEQVIDNEAKPGFQPGNECGEKCGIEMGDAE